MALIKKTIILSEGKNKGYATVVQVGNEVGVKIVGETLREGMQAGVCVGKNTFYFLLTGRQTESPLSVVFGQNDEIGCLVLDGEKVVMKGGLFISPQDIIRRFSSLSVLSTEAKQEIPVSEEEKESFLEKLQTENKNFYLSVKEKIEELFIVYPTETNLSEKIPDSEWVKVAYDGTDYYVVGRLYEDKEIAYLGYGVPGKKSVRPPKIMNKDTVWINIDTQNKNLEGYWLYFQNAKTGVFDTARFGADRLLSARPPTQQGT